MKFIRPKIIGTLSIKTMMAGNLAVVNDIKSTPNKIIIPCLSKEHGEGIIKVIKEAKEGKILYFDLDLMLLKANKQHPKQTIPPSSPPHTPPLTTAI